MQHYADPDSRVPIRCTTWHFRDMLVGQLGGCLGLSWPRFFLWNTKVLLVLGRSIGIDFLGTYPRKKNTQHSKNKVHKRCEEICINYICIYLKFKVEIVGKADRDTLKIENWFCSIQLSTGDNRDNVFSLAN